MRLQRGWTVLATVLTVGSLLACEGSVQGERLANDGQCPEGEICSDQAPYGLIFQGQVLYDEGMDRLGPILVGGRFDLSFFPVRGTLRRVDALIDGDTLEVASSSRSEAELWGTHPGFSTVRIVDAETGELHDRLTLETVNLDDVYLENVNEPSRPALYGGCTEMIGVRLIAGGGRLRAFDQNVSVQAPGDTMPDPLVWDCFRYDVPRDVNEVTFEVVVGGETWVETLPVDPRPLGVPCPESTD